MVLQTASAKKVQQPVLNKQPMQTKNMKNIYFKGNIYIGCEMEYPGDYNIKYDSYSYRMAFGIYEMHLRTLTHYPYLGDKLQDGVEVVEGKDYELQHQYKKWSHHDGDYPGDWRNCTFAVYENMVKVRIVAIGIPKATVEGIDKNTSINGYASGNYTCVCGQCKKRFMGDKLAVRCYSCAVDIAASPLSEKTEVFGKKRNYCNKHKRYFDENQCSVCISEKTEEKEADKIWDDAKYCGIEGVGISKGHNNSEDFENLEIALTEIRKHFHLTRK